MVSGSPGAGLCRPMLPENLILQTNESLKVCARKHAYGTSGRADLIRDIMGLANLAGTDPGYIVLGASLDDDGAIEVTGLNERELAEIEGYPELVRQYLEPALTVRVSVSSMKGKLVGVLEIDGCDNPPYMVCTDLSQDLKSGACWIREPDLFRSARRADLDRMFGAESSGLQESVPSGPCVVIGFEDDPTAQQIAIRIPDLDSAPSALAAKRLQDQISVVKAAGEHDVADSAVARLVHTQQYGSDTPYDERGVNTLVENFNSVGDEYQEADEYYFRESNALKLNFSIRNDSTQILEEVAVVMTLPVVDEFKVVESLCPAPGRSSHENDLLDYPEVSYYQGAAQVRQELDVLKPDAQQELFETSLRVALQPAIRGKKIAIRYALHARGLNEPQEGVLKLLIK